MQVPIMVENINTKDLVYKILCNKYSKTSHRILGVCIYVCIRGGEIIDYWFPAKEIVATVTETPLEF